MTIKHSFRETNKCAHIQAYSLFVHSRFTKLCNSLLGVVCKDGSYLKLYVIKAFGKLVRISVQIIIETMKCFTILFFLTILLYYGLQPCMNEAKQLVVNKNKLSEYKT